MNLYTIGFTQKPAERFFSLLEGAGVVLLVDTRLHPEGQLSGFAKKLDLPFFLQRLAGCAYVHLPQLAPTEDILKDYRQDKRWERYVERFERLMDERRIPDDLDRGMFQAGPVCLLCSEATPERCHRRLVAERIASTWSGTVVQHLV